MRCLSHRRITPPGSDLLLQPANFRQQSDKQAYLLKYQRRFAVVSRVKMRNALSQFIQRLLNARLIGRSVMKCGEFLTVGTERRNIAGERMVQAEQAERSLTDLRRGPRLR